MSQVDFSPLLVQRLQQRDEKAFEMLYENYSAALYGIIFRTLNHKQAAEETLTDAFLKIWNSIDSYDPKKGTLFTWMYRIARNLAIDTRRSHQFKGDLKSTDIDDFVFNLKETEGKENYIGLEKVLQSLGDLCRKLIRLNFFMGFSHAEISKNEDMPLGSVKTKIRSCLKEVKQELKGDFE